MVSGKEIAALIKHNTDDLNMIVQSLVEKAIGHGGEDNVSVILLQQK